MWKAILTFFKKKKFEPLTEQLELFSKEDLFGCDKRDINQHLCIIAIPAEHI